MEFDSWMFWTLRAPHVIGGLLALGAGTVALSALKGGKLHRRSGMIFVYTMLVMAAAGGLLAWFKPVMISVIAGALTFYLVLTSLLTVRPAAHHARAIAIGAMLMALVTGVFGVKFGFDAMNSAKGTLHGYPAAPYFIFGAVALIAAALDARLIVAGGIHGPHRLLRHVWRMCFAMYMATSAFFLGQAKLFPEPLRNFALLSLPVIVVVVVTVFWVLRVALSKRYRRT